MSASQKTKIAVDASTKDRQSRASDPKNSAWVSANAGSGKTYVLTQRVVRLLLAGFDPSRILCLTFTKSAAAEMSNRVFGILSSWAVMDEGKLSETLSDFTGSKTDRSQLRNARRLFARALETPGGLKIQTIHAFCEALLHQFPLEANIAGHFEIMDDRAQLELIADAKKQVIVEAFDNRDGILGRSFAHVIEIASDAKIDSAIGEFIKKRYSLSLWLNQLGGVKPAIAKMRERAGLLPEDTIDTLIGNAFPGPNASEEYLQELALIGASSTMATDTKLAAKISNALAEETPDKKLKLFADLWLTWDGKAGVWKTRSFSRFAAKPLKAHFGDLEQILEHEGERIVDLLQRLNLLKQLDASEALFTIANAIIQNFEKAKRARGLLDFDDLIVRSADLLCRSNASQWVQYKLDQGIDHVLVDEAQDTNPHQWRVITALIEEFFSGSGARQINRTVFAVGDEKQSIYSFQGAEPSAFANQRDRLKKLAKQAEKNFEDVNLRLSFRSVPDVLSAVDRVFSLQENYSGLSRDGEPTNHSTVRQNDPGMVDIWPIIKKIDRPEPEDWEMPVDQLTIDDPQILLANKIAGQIDNWLDKEEILEGKGRPIQAGDILILVRSRGLFASALTRELKRRDIPVAGSDRLRLTDHIAVLDLIALAKVILLPQDELLLAAVLKSPLFDFNEDLLLELAHGRGKISLYKSLQSFALENDVARSALAKLENLRKRANTMRVYEFFALLLGADGGRQKIINRIGHEAEDVLDAFLAQTLSHEQSGLPGMENFIDWLQSSAPEIKREFNLKDNTIKIMTVHAAKGLEAPVVFLIDKGTPPYHGRYDPALVEVEDATNSTDGMPGYLWFSDKKQAAPAALSALEHFRQQAEAEYQRLLYVAMTRAEDRLIICGITGTKDANERCWHNIVSRALIDGCSEHFDENGEMIYHRWQQTKPGSAKEPVENSIKTPSQPTDLPSWIDKPVQPELQLPKPLTPSGAQAMIDAQDWAHPPRSPLVRGEQSPSFALERGIATHRLLQTLPDLDNDAGHQKLPTSEQRRIAANRYLAASFPNWSKNDAQQVVAEVFSVLENPEYEEIFAAGKSGAEISVSGTIELGGVSRLISGQIDRLLVGTDQITIIDYKTNRSPPIDLADIPGTYISQLALYQLLISRIYPNHSVKTALLWSEVPRLVFIPQTMLDEQLALIAQR